MQQKCARRLRKAMRVEFFCFVKKEKDCLFSGVIASEAKQSRASRAASGLPRRLRLLAMTGLKPRQKMRQTHQAFRPRAVAGI